MLCFKYIWLAVTVVNVFKAFFRASEADGFGSHFINGSVLYSVPLEYNIYKNMGGHLSRHLNRGQHPLLLLSHSQPPAIVL